MTAVNVMICPTHVTQPAEGAHHGFDVMRDELGVTAFVFFERDGFEGEWHEVMRLEPFEMRFFTKAAIDEVNFS